MNVHPGAALLFLSFAALLAAVIAAPTPASNKSKVPAWFCFWLAVVLGALGVFIGGG